MIHTTEGGLPSGPASPTSRLTAQGDYSHPSTNSEQPLARASDKLLAAMSGAAASQQLKPGSPAPKVPILCERPVTDTSMGSPTK